MGALELIALAGSLSLLAGWRIYLCVFAAGLAMRTGWLPLPEHLDRLSVISDNMVLGAAFAGLVLELLADKIAWVDSVWDMAHTVIRPLGGALLSLAVIDPQDPAWQIVVLLLGGGLALTGHSAKAGARATINLSPEPVSNVVMSTGEDVTSLGLLAAAFASPVLAVMVFGLLLAGTIFLLITVRRLIGRARRLIDGEPPGGARH